MPTTNGHDVIPGCVLSAPFGWHNHARMIEVATDLGWDLSSEDWATVVAYDTGEETDPERAANDHEAVTQLMDDAEAWLNDHTPTECLVCHGAMEWRNGLYRAVHADTGKMYCATPGAPMGQPQSYIWHWTDGEFYLSVLCEDAETCQDETCAHWSFQ